MFVIAKIPISFILRTIRGYTLIFTINQVKFILLFQRVSFPTPSVIYFTHRHSHTSDSTCHPQPCSPSPLISRPGEMLIHLPCPGRCHVSQIFPLFLVETCPPAPTVQDTRYIFWLAQAVKAVAKIPLQILSCPPHRLGSL